MRLFKIKTFARWAKDERIPDADLVDAVGEIKAGLVDADLGGCLVKKRLARKGQGKRDGYRTILAFRSEDRAFFLHGFAKKDRENVTRSELVALREFAATLMEQPGLGWTPWRIAAHWRKSSMTTKDSRILAEIHESARAFHEAGGFDQTTMRKFDALCLHPADAESYGPAEIKALRARLKVSQPVLAVYLGVTKGTVAGWEQGASKPKGPALRLLSLADRKGLDAIA